MSEDRDVYLRTVERLEPAITRIDRDAALASIAISLKRMADATEKQNQILSAIAADFPNRTRLPPRT